jgi:hypothetical protein
MTNDPLREKCQDWLYKEAQQIATVIGMALVVEELP